MPDRATPLLSHERILYLQKVIVQARLASNRDALLSGIPAAVVAGLPVTSDPGSQILRDLDTLNAIGRLADGSIPLTTWLNNAATLLEGRVEAEEFRQTLQNTKRGAHSSRFGFSKNARLAIAIAATVGPVTCSLRLMVLKPSLSESLSESTHDSVSPPAPMSPGTLSGSASVALSSRVSAADTSAKVTNLPAAQEQSFAGVYRAAWGDTVFTQTGEAVRVTYSDGMLSCTAKGTVLGCTWKDGASRGKCRLTRLPNGEIQGTWGTGESDNDGGRWAFVPKM